MKALEISLYCNSSLISLYISAGASTHVTSESHRRVFPRHFLILIIILNFSQVVLLWYDAILVLLRSLCWAA